MTFNPHTPEDRAAMLAAIGVPSTDVLFEVVPASKRFPNLDLPPRLTEMEAVARLSELASRNFAPPPGATFLGAGSYQHFVPSTVNAIISRGEYFTAYTPYQPEVAQGTLQTIYEFQTMVAELFGMELANASIYDGATALAEAMMMALSAPGNRTRAVITGTVHPNYREVLRTYVEGLPVQLTELPIPAKNFATSVADVQAALDDTVACVIVQYPNFFGAIEDIQAMADAAHAAGAVFIVSTYPVPMGFLTPPGELGADVVAAEGQALGVAQSYGGPYLGLLATQQRFVRQMPGRIVGMTQDAEGKRGFVLALQTREQHIRREKATSNICTNQGLMATAATVHMATLGAEGFREVANRCYQNAHYLASRIAEVPGYRVALDAPFFHEFVVETPIPVAEVNEALLGLGIIGGLDLSSIDPKLRNRMLVCATEVHDRAAIDRFVEGLPR